MKITSLKAPVIIQRYAELLNLAREFACSRNHSRGETRINDDSYDIERRVNTSCHCHPEYEWVVAGTFSEFKAWIDTL